MKRSVEKDKKKRLSYFKNEPLKKVLKAIVHNINLPMNIRKKAILTISSLPKTSSATQLKKRCVLTGRARSVVGGVRMSRMMVSKLAKMGLIPGLRKSSW